jgi:hypothetical protein
MSHSSQGFLVECDAVLRQYLLFLHEQANQSSGDQGAEQTASSSSSKRRKRDDDDNDNDDNDGGATSGVTKDGENANDDDDDDDDNDGDNGDNDDTLFLRHVQIVQLDDTHLFLTGAPLNLQARLQRQVDLLHERHTYTMEGAEIRDNKFKLTAKAGVSKE